MMPEAVRIGVASAAAATIVLAALLLSGAMEPVDLLFPGARGQAQVLIEDFGAEAVPDRFSYDGQDIYVIAREMPDVAQASRDGIPAFRMRRILQPLIAWPAPAGTATVLALVLSNVVGLGLAAGSLADLAARHGRQPLTGYAAVPALAFSLIITTSEPIAFGLGLLGLALVDRARLIPAVAVLGLAALGRETALVMAIAAGVAVARERSWLAGAAVAGLPIVPFGIWVLWLDRLVPADTIQSSTLFGFLDLPDLTTLDVVSVVATVALMVLAVWRWRDVPLAWLTAAGFLAACSFYIGDQYQWHGLPRVSAVGVALGLAALLPAARSGDRDGVPSAGSGWR